jgi:esterase/lipase superfamily enzyme
MLNLFIFVWLCGLITTGSISYFSFVAAELIKPANTVAHRVLGAFALSEIFVHITVFTLLAISHRSVTDIIGQVAVGDLIAVVPLAFAQWFIR